MNILLFEHHELDGTCLHLTGRRSDHVVNVLGLATGDSLRVGMLNGKIGIARVSRVQNGMVDLEVSLDSFPPENQGMELILALPRPIMLQRILKQGTVLGVRRFHLIRSSRVQKSFFQTHLLQPEKLKEVLVSGLEQTVDTRLPEVLVHDRFMPFVNDVMPAMNPSCRLLAHPKVNVTLPDLYAAGKIQNGITLAIGPEGGWVEHEIEQFMEQGFHCFTMGNRILHVDTAVVSLLSQLLLLQDIQVGKK